MNALNLFDDRTLNIFCDASISKFPDETIGCPGSIAVINTPDAVIASGVTRFLRYSSNNNAEITAIMMAIELALSLRESYETINIFSDSKISVYGLRKWIFDWLNDVRDGEMYSSSGTPVANQQIFISIVNLVVKNDFKLNLYHQKGHVSGNGIDIAKKVFLESNDILLTDEEARYISTFNDYIDKATKTELRSMGNHFKGISALQKPIIYYGIAQDRIDHYKTLISPN